jgi:hypothetical protein
MKKALALIVVSVASVYSGLAQNVSAVPAAAQRVLVTNTLPPPHVIAPRATPSTTPAPQQTTPTVIVPSAPSSGTAPRPVELSFGEIKSRIAEAKRTMQTRPMAIAMTEPLTTAVPVRIAYLDRQSNMVEFVVVSKEAFLSANSPTASLSSNGRSITVTTIRANGVNTPVVLRDTQTGQVLIPLMVQYPVERGGRYYETAYYMSTHPGLVTPEVVNAGRLYVHNVIELARQQLKAKGYSIQPKIADMAERLATVEHVDHLRFRTEPHINIFNDIFTLYALNEGQTYRYSVSSAGAGGMVQMIPSTYRMMRSLYPNAALMPDFVEGMRNHVNATQAMLLYMQMTWNDLMASPVVQNAVATGIARPEHLMAAGYNSNPARLPGYISRGGADWATLIPRETKIYLQIWDSLERAVPLTPRKN